MTATPNQPRLGSLGGVRREMARVYADARAGTIAPPDAARMVYCLQAIAKIIETEQIEKQITELEKRVGA